MKHAYLIDISGSISDADIRKAREYVNCHRRPQDLVIVFDIRATLIRNIENEFDVNELMKESRGRGGTDASEAIKLARANGAEHLILLSDGFMAPQELAQVQEWVDTFQPVLFSQPPRMALYPRKEA